MTIQSEVSTVIIDARNPTVDKAIRDVLAETYEAVCC
jgi:hypothetical protein